MSFVSYAQNFEDVMLWRALQHIEHGFYIDIGAQHPVTDSISLSFYEHGWRGVHVEPTQQYSSLLRLARPDETIYQVAIGNSNEKLNFFEFGDTGLSTADHDIAKKHLAHGFKCKETIVSVMSLDTLLYQVGSRDIHWLKVDVEGLEKDVLVSWKVCSNLPWVVVVESTRPLTQDKNHEDWEGLLLSKGYAFVYFDGLNRFYVSPEHSEIVEAFSAPPNIFDGFSLSGTASQPFYSLLNTKMQQAEEKAQQSEEKAQQSEEKAQQAEEKAQQSEEKAQQAEEKAQQAEEKAQQEAVKADEAKVRTHHFEHTITEIYASHSWRITYPMRWSFHQARLLREHGLKSRSKSFVIKIAKPVLNRAFHYVDGRPKLRQKLLTILRKLGFYARFKSIYLNRYPNQSADIQHTSHLRPLDKVYNLSPRAQQIYNDLKTAVERNKEQ